LRFRKERQLDNRNYPAENGRVVMIVQLDWMRLDSALQKVVPNISRPKKWENTNVDVRICQSLPRVVCPYCKDRQLWVEIENFVLKCVILYPELSFLLRYTPSLSTNNNRKYNTLRLRTWLNTDEYIIIT
jgi:hypothetical protein